MWPTCRMSKHPFVKTSFLRAILPVCRRGIAMERSGRLGSCPATPPVPLVYHPPECPARTAQPLPGGSRAEISSDCPIWSPGRCRRTFDLIANPQERCLRELPTTRGNFSGNTYESVRHILYRPEFPVPSLSALLAYVPLKPALHSRVSSSGAQLLSYLFFVQSQSQSRQGNSSKYEEETLSPSHSANRSPTTVSWVL